MRHELEKAVELLHNGEPSGLNGSLSLLQQTVYSFSMKVCGHREDAEDTAQDVLLKAIPYLPRFDSARALGVWLYKVAKNRCLMSRRKSKFAPARMLSLEELMPTREELQILAVPPGGTPEALLLAGERAGHLLQAVRKLPPDYRLVLVLHDMEELQTAEIANILSLQQGTVRVRLHRARLFVRKELARAASQRSPHPSRRALPLTPLRGIRNCKQLLAALSDYLDGAADESVRRRLEEHLDQCPPCKSFLKDLQRTIRQCKDCPSPSMDPAVAARLRATLREECRNVRLSSKPAPVR
jgi:RNA polymerase sigma-70 factor (ECF subfamily)